MKTKLNFLLVLTLVAILVAVNAGAAQAQAQVVITISPDTLLNAAYDIPYNQQLTASGGTEPYTFSLSGNLPDGFNLSANGFLSGFADILTNSIPGTYPITIQVQDGAGATASREYNFVLDKGTPTVTIYASGTGGYDDPIYWNYPFTLWADVGIANRGVRGTANFFVDGSPVAGCQEVYLNGLLAVCRDIIMSLSLGVHSYEIDYWPTGYENYFEPAAESGTFIVQSGFYSIVGTLFKDIDQDGVYDYGSDKLLVDTWTVNLDQDCDGVVDQTNTTSTGMYAFYDLPGGHCYRITEVVKPGWQQINQPPDLWLSSDISYGLDIGNYYPTIIISPDVYELPFSDAGLEYNQTFTASGGAEPYLYTIVEGSLPAGLTLSTEGALSGTPTLASIYTFAIKAEDANHAIGYRTYSLTIKTEGVFTFTSSSNPSASGEPVTFSLSATGNAIHPYMGSDPVPPLGLVTFLADGTAIEGCTDLLLNIGFDPDGYQILGNYPAICATAAFTEGMHQITATYTDYSGLYHSAELSLAQVVGLTNTAPTANPGGPYLAAVNTAIAFDGSLSSDPDGDELAYAWGFGDGGASTDAMPSHIYATAGIYPACLTVNDGTEDSAPVCTWAVIFDPSAGFVTGSGWIDSPAGAYMADPTLTGRATFGFVSKYKKGATVPEGTTGFQFQAGSFSFTSIAYEWLLVSKTGNTAQFKGSGLVNGAADPNDNPYKFQIWAGDGSPDTFRIKIWWEDASGEHEVYDNGFDQAIGGGSIIVHVSK